MKNLFKLIAFIVWAGVLIWGCTGLWQRLFGGERVANYGSYVPWGLWVAAKVYFVGIGVGTSLFAWIAYGFQIKRFYPMVRTALLIAAIAIAMGVLVITMDLGHMFRSFEVLYRPNFTSLLAWATWLTFIYLGYIVLILVKEMFSTPLTDRGKKIAGIIGLFIGIAFSGGNGAEFGAIIASPYWHSTLGPISSIAAALTSGMAVLLVILCLFFKDQLQDYSGTIHLFSRIVIGLIIAFLVLEWAEYSISSWYGVGEAFDLRQKILFGPYWYVFWIIHLGIGSVIPLLLLFVRPADRMAAGSAGFLTAATFLAVRLNMVIPGQITPAMKGLQEAYVDNRLQFTYFPSSAEWAVVAFCVCLGVAIFFLGQRFLPLTQQSR